MATTGARSGDGGRPSSSRRRASDRIARSKQRPDRKGLVLRLVMLAVVGAGVAGGLWWMRQQRMDSALQSLSTFSVPAKPGTLFGSLPDTDKHMLRQAATLGAGFVPRLVASYTGSTEGGKFGIIYCLGQISGREAEEFLTEVIEEDPQAAPARAAALCLGAIGGPGVRLQISRWAKSADADLGELAILAARASSDRDLEDSLRALEPLRKSTEPRLQLALLAALQSLPFDTRGTPEFMIDLLIDGDERVSGVAFATLRDHTGDLNSHGKRMELRKAIHKRGVNHRNFHVQLNSRRLMRGLGGPDIQRTSRKDLDSDNAQLVREAGITLLELGDNPAVKYLIPALARSDPEATRSLAAAVGGLAKVSGRGVKREYLADLRELAAEAGVPGAGACYALALLGDDSSLPLIHGRFTGAAEGQERTLIHDALVELAGADKGPRPADWSEWWARNEKIFELRREVQQRVEAAKAIGATGERERYPEAKKILHEAQEMLFALEELEGSNYTRWQTDIGSMLDGLHKHTIIDLEDDDDLWDEEEKKDEDGEEEED